MIETITVNINGKADDCSPKDIYVSLTLQVLLLMEKQQQSSRKV